MSLEAYVTEHIIRIHTPDGEFYEIGPDSDGLGCVEVRYHNGTEYQLNCNVIVPPALALKLAAAIDKVARDMGGYDNGNLSDCTKHPPNWR